jgi:hypothetical protein
MQLDLNITRIVIYAITNSPSLLYVDGKCTTPLVGYLLLTAGSTSCVETQHSA